MSGSGSGDGGEVNAIVFEMEVTFRRRRTVLRIRHIGTEYIVVRRTNTHLTKPGNRVKRTRCIKATKFSARRDLVFVFLFILNERFDGV